MYGKIVLAGLAFAFAAMPLAAKTRIYECSLPDAESWLPDVAIIAHDQATGDVMVDDPYIEHYIGHPIEARLETENDKRITVTWTVEITNRSGQYTRMSYRATVVQATRAITMSAHPNGYVDNFVATGTCKVSEKK